MDKMHINRRKKVDFRIYESVPNSDFFFVGKSNARPKKAIIGKSRRSKNFGIKSSVSEKKRLVR